jgi:hypothetical protein
MPGLAPGIVVFAVACRLTQNIENNPMQSSSAVFGMRDSAKTC